MKHFLKRLLLFSVFVLFAYPALLYFWGEAVSQRYKPNVKYRKGSYGHMFSRLQEARKIKDTDILFLGSSHTYRGFDPRIFEKHGFESFNLGSSSQTPLQTKMLMKRYLAKMHPELIIYEVYPWGFVSDGVESSIDIISNDYIDKNTLKMTLSVNHITVYNSLIFAYIKENVNPNTVFKEQKKRYSDTYISGGYVEKELSFYEGPEETKKIRWSLNEKQWEAFSEIIQTFRERNIPYLLVYAPVSPSRYNSFVDYSDYRKKISQYGDFIDFNKMNIWNDSLHFYDAHHLNQKGTERFNDTLISILKEKYPFLKNSRKN